MHNREEVTLLHFRHTPGSCIVVARGPLPGPPSVFHLGALGAVAGLVGQQRSRRGLGRSRWCMVQMGGLKRSKTWGLGACAVVMAEELRGLASTAGRRGDERMLQSLQCKRRLQGSAALVGVRPSFAPGRACLSLGLRTSLSRASLKGAEACLASVQEMRIDPDQVKCMSEVKACIESGKLDRARACFEHMVSSSIELDVRAYNRMLGAYSRIGDADMAECWLDRMLHASVEVDVVSYNMLISACAKRGQTQRAEEWLAKMLHVALRADGVSYNSVIASCAKGGDADRAAHWLEQMSQRALRPDEVSYNSLMKACARVGDAPGAEQWLEQMRLAGLSASCRSYTGVIDACAKAGEVQRAEQWLQRMLQLGLRAERVSCSSVINACAQQGEVDRAERWLQWMLDAGLEADGVAYSMVLKACAKRGDAERAELWLETMLGLRVEANVLSYSSVIHACAQRGAAKRAEQWLERMLQVGLKADTVTYCSMMNACAKSGDSIMAEQWLERMLEAEVHANAMCYSSVINACAQSGELQRAELWFGRMLRAGLAADKFTFGSMINACAQSGSVSKAEEWLARMQESRLHASEVCYHSVINACARSGQAGAAERWLSQMPQFRLQPDQVSYNTVINACAQSGEVRRAEQWLERMVRGGLTPDEVSYNSLINACSQQGDVRGAEAWIGRMARARLAPNEVSYKSVLHAYARMGEQGKAEAWLERMLREGVPGMEESWLAEIHDPLRTGSPVRRALYRFASAGDPWLVECLERALEFQWLYGYPHAPLGEPQLTHGTYQYLSGMQPMTVREMMKLVPGARSVLDPFCGSGAVLIEALAAGKVAVGCDASPLAIFVSRHHCGARGLEPDELLRLAEEVAAPLRREEGDWQALRSRIAALPAGAALDALWFVFAVAIGIAAAPAEQSSEGHQTSPSDPDGCQAKPYFVSSARRYVARLQDLRQRIHGPGALSLHHCDSCTLRLQEPVDAILTSPPYPGVYNYFAAGELLRSRVDGSSVADSVTQRLAPRTCDVLPAPLQDPDGRSRGLEMGARERWRPQRMGHLALEWQAEQERWLSAMCSNLVLGGTATLMIGDGDTDAENGFDCLAPTLAAAVATGFDVIATATIESVADDAHCTKGMRRTEHMVHLRRVA